MPGQYRGSCSTCPVGRYTGWETERLDECRLCETGYQDEEGSGNCKTCPAGRISSAAHTTCVTCPLGEYSDAENLIECKTCSATGEQHTGIIGQKIEVCTTGNTKGSYKITTKGLRVADIELSGPYSDPLIRNLQRCVGHCHSDANCAPGLLCFQRSNNEPIPGCKGNGGGDYCYDPGTSPGTRYGYQAALNDVVMNNHSTYKTNCLTDTYQNTFDGDCKGCPVGLYKEGTDPQSLKIVGPNDFNVCKFCPAGRIYTKPACVDCVVRKNKGTLKDFPHQQCRYTDCPEGSFAQSGECSECPTGTYWESERVLGIPYVNSILHSCDQIETQFYDSLSADERELMKADCVKCYKTPLAPLQLDDQGLLVCVDWQGKRDITPQIDFEQVYESYRISSSLEEEKNECATTCRGRRDAEYKNRADSIHGDNLDITGFIIWVKDGDRSRGKCTCAVNTDVSACTLTSVDAPHYGYIKTYRFESPACMIGKELRASTTAYSGLCRSCPVGQYQHETGQDTCKSCPVGQYQHETGQDTCKSCPTATTTAATSC